MADRAETRRARAEKHLDEIAEHRSVEPWSDPEHFCDEACSKHQPDCDRTCRHLAGHINECNRRWAESR